ncbi:MAG: DNA-binding response regulator, partial [Chloroflexi bacterium]|nr:DNA-binding response regulator [Chloroflexota bacterium]
MAKEILIVEDEGFIAGLLRKSLSRKGYEITVL